MPADGHSTTTIGITSTTSELASGVRRRNAVKPKEETTAAATTTTSSSSTAQEHGTDEDTPQNSTSTNSGQEEEEAVEEKAVEEKPQLKIDPRDPLRWFGILVPPALRSSQSAFSQGKLTILPPPWPQIQKNPVPHLLSHS